MPSKRCVPDTFAKPLVDHLERVLAIVCPQNVRFDTWHRKITTTVVDVGGLSPFGFAGISTVYALRPTSGAGRGPVDRARKPSSKGGYIINTVRKCGRLVRSIV